MLKMNLHRITISKVSLILALGVISLFPLAASANHSCEVSPFSKRIKQSESVLYEVLLHPSSPTSSFAIKMGNLPISVESGFVSVPTSTSNGKTPERVSVVLKSKANAQIGSFSLVVLYHEDVGAGVQESVCQLNIIIEESVGQKLVTTPSPSPDSLVSIPTNLVSRIEVLAKGRKGPITFLATTPKNLSKSLSRGSRGEAVKTLQNILKSIGLFPSQVESTGYFGPITETAVKAFQAREGIEQVGIVGPLTRSALDKITK